MGKEKKEMQLELVFSARVSRSNLAAIAPEKKSKPCLSCGGKVLGWRISKRICRRCKRDPEWKSAAKGLSDMYSVEIRVSRKGTS